MTHLNDAMWRGAGSVQLLKSSQIPWPTEDQLRDYSALAQEDSLQTLRKEGRFRMRGMLAFTLFQVATLVLLCTLAIRDVALYVVLPIAAVPMLTTLWVRVKALNTLY